MGLSLVQIQHSVLHVKTKKYQLINVIFFSSAYSSAKSQLLEVLAANLYFDKIMPDFLKQQPFCHCNSTKIKIFSVSASTLKCCSLKVLGASEPHNISKTWEGLYQSNIKVATDSVTSLLKYDYSPATLKLNKGSPGSHFLLPIQSPLS